MIDEYRKNMEDQERKQQEHEKASCLRQELLDADLSRYPTIWPCRGYITSYFGNRRDPFNRKRIEWHPGVDIKGDRGDPIMATGGGIVTWTGYRGNYGNLIIIKHDDRIQTRYGHLSGYAVVEGEEVVRGQVIGYMGCTGRCTGPHLHYEVIIDGERQDPMEWMR